jgi:carbamoyltransferase
VNVRKDKRELLGAVTHVDGTARIQTVSRATNEKYWNLIRTFQQITGVPILLNTSFNNNVEPIVDSVEDAIVCFLTTNIDYLVVGGHLTKKKVFSSEQFLDLKVSVPPYVSLHCVRKTNCEGRLADSSHLAVSYDSTFQKNISAEFAHILAFAGQEKSAREILSETANSTPAARAPEIANELTELWSLRLITCRP